MKSKTKIFWIIILIAFVAADIYMLFHNLGRGFLVQTDEAWHATNGYEMFKQGNWIINSYRYAADYFNSKPPLCLDLMMVSYKIFGVSNFAARFPSALGGLITIALITAFLIKDKKTYAAALFPALFGACSTFFTFHMYRAAEMDSIYNLFFVIAMLSLYMMAEKPNFMYLYGLSFGLAFMCKGPHSALIFVIGLLYIPKCKEAFKSILRVIISALLAAVIPLAWMAKRYMFDGMELINRLFMGEVAGRVSSASQTVSAPIIDFFTSNAFFGFVAIIIAVVIVSLITKRSGKAAEAGNTSATETTAASIKSFVWDNYLFIIWSTIPVVFFAITRSFLSWYTYTAQIALCILTARLAEYCIKDLGKE
ncbi:MAG: glycosyltransferase family 39 protein, partial [Butyrivibrio sp.]|nr:glycosyltransferase family 39 protein [Butyrivibrio sp.]